MAVKPIPDGFHTVTPYLLVKGAGGLIDFAKQAFGAEEVYRSTLPDGDVMHALLRIGDSMVMLGEARGEYSPMQAMLHLYVEDVDSAFARAVQAGGVSLREPANQFYGDRSGGLKDEWGNQWWISTHVEDVSAEEIERRQKAMMQH
jgi:PhnB protein